MLKDSKPNSTNDSLLPWYARPAVDLQHILPHHLISTLFYYLSRSDLPILKNLLIKQLISLYHIDMNQAQESDPNHYTNFNDFFTRALREEARPKDQTTDAILAPVDATLYQIGTIRNNRLLQAKKRDYNLLELLGGDAAWEARFIDGQFITLNMSLGDSHRVYMPLDGELIRMRHIPGRLFDINRFTLHLIPKLFLRNERVICLFETTAGPMAVILIGTLFVGGIETTWSGTVTPTSRRIERWDYATSPTPIRLGKGIQLGRFNMGSTVILLFGRNRIEWLPNLQLGTTIRMGTKLGKVLISSN